MDRKKDYMLIAGKVLLFSGIFCVILCTLSILFRPKSNDNVEGIKYVTNEADADCITSEPAGSIDLLLLGDSEAFCSFSPLQFWHDEGWSAYCVGTAGQRLYDTVYYLQTALKKQQPKVLVLETDVVFRRCSPEQCLYSLLSRKIPGVAYHDRWKVLSKEEFSLDVNYTGRAELRGFYLSDWTQSADTENIIKQETAELRAVPFMNRIYIRQIEKLCQENGMKLIFVTAPNTLLHNQKMHNSIVKLSEEMGVPYYDLNDAEQMPGELAIDWNIDSRDGGDHMNIRGALKTSERLRQIIKEEAALPDHRGDESYSYMEDQYTEYQSRVDRFFGR